MNNKPHTVDGDVEPISGKPIQQVDAQDWDSMSVSKLFEQRNVLTERMQFALSSGHPEIAKQVQLGIHKINFLITKKQHEQQKRFQRDD